MKKLNHLLKDIEALDDSCSAHDLKKKDKELSFLHGVNYNKIKRFINSRVGQKWDDVWKELCERFDSRTTLGRINRRAVHWIVDTKQSSIHRFTSDFIVDAAGVLKEGPWAEIRRGWRIRNKAKSTIVRIGSDSFYQFNGLWFKVKFEKHGSCPRYVKTVSGERLYAHCGREDVFYGKEHNYLFRLYGEDSICVWKKSANKKEIKLIQKAIKG